MNMRWPQLIERQTPVGILFSTLACELICGTGVTFCRVLLTRQTAEAHCLLLDHLGEIVRDDTGEYLRWRHIHTDSVDDTDGMILQYTADQHGGQAKGWSVRMSHGNLLISVKGLGLHLQKVASRFPRKHDLHEPHRLLASLSAWEHIHRLFWLCTVHR